MIPTLLLPYKFLEYPDITLYPPFRMKSFHIEVLQKQIHEFLFFGSADRYMYIIDHTIRTNKSLYMIHIYQISLCTSKKIMYRKFFFEFFHRNS